MHDSNDDLTNLIKVMVKLYVIILLLWVAVQFILKQIKKFIGVFKNDYVK